LIHNRKNAFVLLSTMLVVLVLGIFLRVAVLRMNSELGVGRHSTSHQLAEDATESGTEYALARLREDPTWRGGTGQEVVIRENELEVVEDEGNVVGTIRGDNGAFSEFRIRFNYQDGDGAEGDGRPDPSAFIENPFVSINNLESGEEAVVPRGNGSNASVVDPAEGYTTPERSVCLIVEGRAYQGERVVATEVMETVHLLAHDSSVPNAVIMAGSEFDALLSDKGRLHLSSVSSDAPPRIRTKGSVNVVNATGENGQLLPEDTAEVSYDHKGGDIKADFSADKVTLQDEYPGDGQDFYQLPWSSVKKAGTGGIQLQGGTYVYGKWGTDKFSLRYFDMPVEEYRESEPDPSQGIPLSADLKEARTDALTLSPSQLSVKPQMLMPPLKEGKPIPYKGFAWDVQDVDINVVSSSGGVDSFAVIPETKFEFIEGDGTGASTSGMLGFSLETNPDHLRMTVKNSTLSTEGDLTVHGGITGDGGIFTSGGETKIQAGRMLTMDTGSTISRDEWEEIKDNGGSSLDINIYSRDKLTISTYSPVYRGYRSLTFRGLLYSWADISLVAFGGGKDKKSGVINITGSVIAYGGDPGAESPGSVKDEGKTGKVDLRGRDISLEWDPRFDFSEITSENVGFAKVRTAFPSK
jgi:hypothetical protein